MKSVFIATVVLGLLAWCINGITAWIKAGHAIYALAGMM